jgi:hypothetical protein
MAGKSNQAMSHKTRKTAKWLCGGDVAKNLRQWAKQFTTEEMLAKATEYDRKNAAKHERRAALNRAARAAARGKVAQ